MHSAAADTSTSDAQLLQLVAADRNNAAFEQLVHRHLRLVYNAAQRQTGGAMADDVTQAVFQLLWERTDRVRNGSTLAGWLVNATRLIARQAQRSEFRRRRRERVAAENRPLITGDAVSNSNDDLLPLLDEAFSKLGETERTAIAMRYLQNKSLAKIADQLGISQPAAAKRVSRALDRLRSKFARRGAAMSVPAIEAAMQLHGQHFVPPDALPQRVIQHVAGGGNAAAAQLVRAVNRSMAIHKLSAIALVSVTAMLLLAATWFAAGAIHGQSTQAQAALPATTASDTRIKVGIIVSVTTATSSNTGGGNGHFEKQTRIADDLNSPDMDFYPIIEPGSENNPDLPQVLQTTFPDKTPINGTDPDAMRKMDVIVANEVWETTPELLNALEATVRSGKPLLNCGGIGSITPGMFGDNSVACSLTGLQAGRFLHSETAVECVVLADHSILGDLFGNGHLFFRPNGPAGILPPDAIPLVKVLNTTGLFGKNPAYKDFISYPLFISHLGQGKIISVTFSAYSAVPPQLEGEGRSRFFIRCVRWLTGRAVK